MTSIELDMVQTAGIGALALIAVNKKGCLSAEILYSLASKRWYHLFIDYPHAIWVVRY